MPKTPKVNQKFDLIVAGGGVAGMCAAMSAARNGLKVALVNDRPILGGCNSSEIRVHLGGRVNVTPYKNLGTMLKEFGHIKSGNAKPAENYMDQAKEDFIGSNENITLFPNNRLVEVVLNKKERGVIESVVCQHIESGERTLLSAPLFSDCTGDGTLGYLAGAHYRIGREARSEFNESEAPEVADSVTMGASVQWYSKLNENQISTFPIFKYGVDFNASNREAVTMGEWTWETGMNRNQITEAEYIRDYGLLVIYSNWSYLKNSVELKNRYANRELDWVAYIAGKRESRRLMGDYLLTGNDVINYDVKKDGTASTTWSVDLHYPAPKNIEKFPTGAFLSIAKHINVFEYPVPYRCLYSRNVKNLFMAGRNISVTHMALGTTRVMRTTAMLGEVVGMAASVCRKYSVRPREVYTTYFDDLKSLMLKGSGIEEQVRSNQNFNIGGHLKEPKNGSPIIECR